MTTNVIMPALGMAQETGKLIRWLVEPGATVKKGDLLMEVETDKATVEIEATGSGFLTNVTAAAGDEIPVGRVIAVIATPGESAGASPAPTAAPAPAATGQPASAAPPASPLAARIAAENGVDLRFVTPKSGRVEKADVVAFIEAQRLSGPSRQAGRVLASPKARRLASEQGLSLAHVPGTGPEGAVQAADVLAIVQNAGPSSPAPIAPPPPAPEAGPAVESVGTIWHVMAERMTQSWTTVPHFYLVREVNAERLVSWRAELLKRQPEKVTFTDLLVRITAAALVQHPRLTSSWRDGGIQPGTGVHIGIAMAVELGLVVPVIHDADRLSVGELAAGRQQLAARAQAGRLRLEDLQGGNFTISNLGMYGVDAFNAIVNPPQAAILAVGRIADRVVAVNGQPAVRPTMILSLSCDHRAVDGARGAAFLHTLAALIEEPLSLLP